MIHQIHIQVTIPVIIKEYRLIAEADIIKSEFGSHFPKGPVLLIDEQEVGTILCLEFAGTANINVQPTVTIHIRHCNTCLESDSNPCS